MSSFEIHVGLYTVGGPYGYTIFKNGFGHKTASGFANIGAAWDAIRNDLIAAVQTETVQRITINLSSS